MAIEKPRGCGFRKVGGLYLVGTGIAVPCDRLPFELSVCPVCGQGYKVTTGFTWVQPQHLFGGVHKNCQEQDDFPCPICNPEMMGEIAGLQWVGSRFYTPQSFIKEAQEQKVSKRIPFVPKQLEIGKTWILLAHKQAVEKVINQYRTDKKPGIFYAFKPTAVEKLIWKSEATEEVLEDLKKRGITPVIISDGDEDHDPKRSVWSDLSKLKKQEIKE